MHHAPGVTSASIIHWGGSGRETAAGRSRSCVGAVRACWGGRSAQVGAGFHVPGAAGWWVDKDRPGQAGCRARRRSKASATWVAQAPIRWGSSAPGCGRGARTGQGRPAAGTAGPWVRRRPGRRPGRAGAARPGRLFFTTRTSSQHGLRPPQLVATAPRPWAGGCVRRGAGQAQQRPDQRRRASVVHL